MSEKQVYMGKLLDELRLDKTSAKTEFSKSKNRKWLLSLCIIMLLGGSFYINNSFSIPSRSPEPVTQLSNATTQSVTFRQSVENKATAVELNKNVSDASQLNASGYLYAKRQATVSSQTTGRLVKIYVEEGNKIESGQLVAELDVRILKAQLALANAQLVSKESSAKQTKLLLEEAQSKFERTAQIASKKLNTVEEYERDRFAVSSLQARLATDLSEINVSREQINIQQEILNNSYIYAPFDGVVVERSAQIGEIVSPVSAGGGYTRTGICTLVDLSSLEGEVHVNERFIDRVHTGQAVTLSVHAYPDLKVKGKVHAIMPSVNKETGAIKVKISLSESDSRLLPNMGIDAIFTTENHKAFAHNK